MIDRLRVTVLADNSVTTAGLLAEHGLSILVETNDRRILFDTGPGKVLRANAEALSIHLAPLDAVVLSHGHYDHTGGLADLLQTRARSPFISIQRRSNGSTRRATARRTVLSVFRRAHAMRWTWSRTGSSRHAPLQR